ncbi:hypothetical protein SAMN02745220_00892 [Desulfopila aestuarii DSM 18488]|uniref:YgjP-like metallopeptidase domain-containing protein n=1 Tax=Desulfopila aestuarii DSM 18488 TaxID=1121416 RepID=A0A1M7XZW2_9BACT|nr:hypothetical protein SAMN02745220_00892 [Desulfopila aestuarii DSM 18488]
MKTYSLVVHDLVVTVQKKRVKNINLAIYPPDGRIRVSAPIKCSEETISAVIRARLGWINKKRAALLARPSQVVVEMVTGDTIDFFGQRYPLVVVEKSGTSGLQISNGTMELTVMPESSTEKKVSMLNEWYRRQLQLAIPDLLAQWQPKIGVTVNDWRIRRMKSRWGSCNILDRHIWLNLELAKLSPVCLEYVLVHELTHLLERYHNARFWSFMDQFLPHWRELRRELKSVQIT